MKALQSCITAVCVFTLVLLVVAPPADAAFWGEVAVVNGNNIQSVNPTTGVARWTTAHGLGSDASVHVVPGVSTTTVLVTGGGQTKAYDGLTGGFLWGHAGGLASWMNRDVRGQLYTDPIRYPFGAPNIGGGASPDILLSASIGGAEPYATYLVDSRTGGTVWTRTFASNTTGFGFIPRTDGKYDALFGPTGLYRVNGDTGAGHVWYRAFSNRFGIPVPDVTGDGQYDLFAEPSYYTSTVYMLNGAGGGDVWSLGYGSFDVLQIPQVVRRAGGGYDVIVSAQLAAAGGVRRYRTENGSVVWDCNPTYDNNTILGMLNRADGGLTIVSGWRHQARVVALDAATGAILWDNVPAGITGNTDYPGIGVPDLTGDGNDDWLRMADGTILLYDGLTGAQQMWFTSFAGTWAAYNPIPEPSLMLLLAAGAALMGLMARHKNERDR